MAKNLNKTRMRDSRILMVIAFLIALISKPAIEPESGLFEAFEVIGFTLLATCAIGRIYSTAFIGGAKNDKLITAGPYSMCRNPLYFYSLLGAAGIGMMSERFTIMAFLVGGFVLIYHGLISREEEFLAEKFGSDYTDFCAKTPRLMPAFSKYTCPSEVVFQSRYLNKAVKDAIWWFAAMPIFETIEYLQGHGIIKPLFTLY